MLRVACALMILVSLPSFAGSQMIYGLQEGTQLQDKAKGSVYYLQVGAFKQKENANRVCKKARDYHLQAKVNPPQHPSSLFTVVYGPLKSPAEVRRISQLLLSKKPVLAVNQEKRVKKEKTVKMLSYIPKLPETSAATLSLAEKKAPVAEKGTTQERPSIPVTQEQAQQVGPGPLSTKPVPQEENISASADELEDQARKLYFQSAQLDVEIRAAHSEADVARLKKQQIAVNQKLDALVNEVIRRVSETG